MDDTAYRKLAQFLDRLPGGFPPSTTSAEIRILKRLFTEDEAELALHLTLDQEEVGAIAARTGRPLADTARRLAEMAVKGLVFSPEPGATAPRYQAVPWIVGIWEFQVNRLDAGLLRDIAEYRRTQARRPAGATIAQLRTIPVGRSLDPGLGVLTYERIDELVKGQERIAVTACLCRRAAKMAGAGCAAPEETCLSFGAFAEYYVETGRGRRIDRSELTAILRSAERASLVLQPSNSQDISFLCCCCGCCCGALKGFQAHPRPVEAATSPFAARLDAEECNGCDVCVGRCQMQALTAGEDHVLLNAARCIGCGLCVSVCPTGALSLVRKPDSPRGVPPATFDDTWRTMLQAQARPS